MTTIKIVRYTTAPEHSDSNERLVRDVYAELAETEPEGATTPSPPWRRSHASRRA